jgi:D-ornithine 4,5-aminomutase subunit beta
MYNVEACDTAKQALVGMDSLSELVTIRTDGYMYDKVREIKERAILFFEELLEQGGYFQAVEKGSFIDSGIYPQRNGDGIVRKINGGIGHGTIYERDHDYFAPVTAHFGNNNTIQYNIKEGQSPSVLIGGCSFEDRSKIQYIDELDMEDNVNVRMELTQKYRTGDIIKPEVEWLGDGTLVVDITLPTDVRHAEAAALEIGAKMNLKNVEIIHREILHPAEATRIQLKGQFDFDIDVKNLKLSKIPDTLSDAEISDFFKDHPIKIVAGTIGEDEHSVGLREIIDIKHGGIEKYGIMAEYLGTSVPPAKLVDAAIEINAKAILMSTIISHDEIHYRNMKKVVDYAIEKGVRNRLIIIAGGTQVTPDIASAQGVDAGFGRGTKGRDVASFLVKRMKEMMIHEN